MSTHKVTIEKVVEVTEHPNAERLDIIRVLDWQVVTQKGTYQVGDLCVYIPIDSILPETLETFIFGPDSKIKLDKHRIKTIKLRGAVSQGMCLNLVDYFKFIATQGKDACIEEGKDVTEILGISKYEPPESSIPSGMQAGNSTRKQLNPYFRKYTDIENAKNYPNVFQAGEYVWVSEKLHGTSARFSNLPTEASTFWKKIKKLFGLLPKYEFCVGSRNAQLQDSPKQKTFYKENVYLKIAEQENLQYKLAPGEAVYGEICGHGVQGSYTYGHRPGKQSLYVYDVMINGKWLDYEDMLAYCQDLNLKTVPVFGKYPYSREHIDDMKKGPSHIGNQPIREGVVIRSEKEQHHPLLGRKLLKFVSEDFLLQKEEPTSFH